MCAVLVFVGVIAVTVKWAPQWLASTKGLNPNQRVEEYGRVRTALLASFAGAIAVLGVYYTSRTLALSRQGHDLNRQGQITERFTRAVDQLGSQELDVRLGGIYALERLARESRDDHAPIVEILTAYVREHAPWPPRTDAKIGHVSADVQAALSVLGRRNVAHDTILGPINLNRTDLQWAVLEEAHLEGVALKDAQLKDARLARANLFRAHLEGTILLRAHLDEANLQSARLEGANLTQAHLDRARLEGAIYSPGTKWPDGFDPAAHGAVLKE